MKAFLRVADQYYVLANSVLADQETRVLKQGETFAIFDSYGDIQPVTHSQSGLFHRGTRHLSRWELDICGDQRLLLLNSTLRDDNGVLKVDMTNPDLNLKGVGFIPKGTLHVHRESFLLESRCHERITLSSYGPWDLEIDVSLRFDADFADIFEVRGTKRSTKGRLEPVERTREGVKLVYVGLDGIHRSTVMWFSLKDFVLDERNVARFPLRIPARESAQLDIVILSCQETATTTTTAAAETSHREALLRVHSDHVAGRQRYCAVRTSNEQFELWMKRSTDDLVMMTTEAEKGRLYPYAGIPWFCCPFGRDGILTALECLWANTDLARGVLAYLAHTQANERVPERDATPGKIIHEVRYGEMANLKEIPFGRYYGSVDSTPLFVCLGGAYLARTGDLEFIRALWPSFERAIFWIDRFGDLDGDGFVEYQRENPNGLVQQGWKDSNDSVFHSDDSDARGPIALCEVQGYAYMAREEGARMAEALGHRDFAIELRRKASALRESFDQTYWVEELGTFALALDGDKRPCRVRSSNAGQLLFTGIVKPERISQLIGTLMSPESFSGWGVRTIPKGVPRYNPMSYHNGSVWPHDNALIAWGMALHGHKDGVEKIFNGLFRAVMDMELYRMPEVFCGFTRREGEAPTLYPHACSPQAWAAASVYLLVQALLGIKVDGIRKKVSFFHPHLPAALETLKIHNLIVGNGSVDLVVQNYHSDVSVQISRRQGDVAVSVEK